MARPRSSRARRFDMARQRLTDIMRLVKGRHHGRLPDTDDALIYVELAADHFPRGQGFVFALCNWARQLGRVLTAAEVKACTERHPKRYKAPELGALLRLTFSE